MARAHLILCALKKDRRANDLKEELNYDPGETPSSLFVFLAMCIFYIYYFFKSIFLAIMFVCTVSQ